MCYGENFAIRSSQISKRPQELWASIEQTLSGFDNVVEVLYQECLWVDILSEALSSEDSQTLGPPS